MAAHIPPFFPNGSDLEKFAAERADLARRHPELANDGERAEGS